MYKLSIIVTSYNIEEYIEECLQSIFAQTFSDYELIVVDDASTDSSAEVADRLCAGKSNCRVIRLPENTPGGAGAPSNVGIDAATGTFIGFVDGDDFAHPEMFSTMVARAERDNADVVIGDYRNFTSDSGIRYELPADAKRWPALLKSSDSGDIQKFKIDVLKMVAVPWRKIYRREFLNDGRLRFPEGDFFYEDNPFHWFTTYAANRISLVPEELIFHRVSRAGQTMGTTDARLLKMFVHFDTIRDFLDRTNAPRAYKVRLCRWAISQMEWISRQLLAEHRPQLYQVFRKCMLSVDRSIVRDALREQHIGMWGGVLTWFAVNGNEKRFLEYVGGRKRIFESERVRILYMKGGIGLPALHYGGTALGAITALSGKILGAAASATPGNILRGGAQTKELKDLKNEIGKLHREVVAMRRLLLSVELERMKATQSPLFASKADRERAYKRRGIPITVSRMDAELNTKVDSSL